LDRIALDAYIHKEDIKSLCASHYGPNFTTLTKPIYVGIDFTTQMLNSKPQISILNEDDVPEECRIALEAPRCPTQSKVASGQLEHDVPSLIFLGGLIPGPGVDIMLWQVMPAAVLF
jgi:hypothetical protein